jgi:hypothetical protein
VSPQVLRILKSSGKSFDGITIDHNTDDEEPVNRNPGSPADSKAG